MNHLSVAIEQRLHLSGFGRSFLDGSLIFCIGAMAIIGSLNDGLLHQPQVLIVKGVLDGTTSVILAAAEGPGVIFSAIPVALYQGAITLLAGSLSSVLAGQLLKDICMGASCCLRQPEDFSAGASISRCLLAGWATSRQRSWLRLQSSCIPRCVPASCGRRSRYSPRWRQSR